MSDIKKIRVGGVDYNIPSYDEATTEKSGLMSASDKIKLDNLAVVSTSGSYNDLTNKPTIPNAVSESTVSGWGFTKNIGTITGVSANGTSIATSGVANIPAASTGVYGVTKLSSSTSSTSTSLAATASAVKSAYDLANGRQEKLVSGTNIKTINGESILGSGNINISGGSSSSGTAAYPLVNCVIGGLEYFYTINPNTFYLYSSTNTSDGSVEELAIEFGSEIDGVANEYIFQFTSGANPTTLTFPDNIKWTDEFTIEANKIYQISILNGLGTVMSWGV